MEVRNGNGCSPASVTCRLSLTYTPVNSVFIYLIFIILLSVTVLYSTPQSLSHCLSLTLSLSFCHNSKYPVGPGCRLLVLVYLALGSIRLQAEASHSSQSHKMWLVLTTALQGDGLIGLIASDRLGWTLYRKTAATACCGFILVFFSLLFFFPFFSVDPYLLFSHSHLCQCLSQSLFLPHTLCLYIWLSSDSFSLYFISHFFCLLHILAWQACIHTNYIANLKASVFSFTFFLSSKSYI